MALRSLLARELGKCLAAAGPNDSVSVIAARAEPRVDARLIRDDGRAACLAAPHPRQDSAHTRTQYPTRARRKTRAASREKVEVEVDQLIS